MKELSIEEKARRYDEALKVLHKYDGANIMFSQSLKEEMFPELAGSKDERIRKELIAYCQVNMGHTWHNIKQEDYIAWLEKQGEPTYIPADAVLDSNKDGLITDTIRYKREKQGEQKPADKVEPKFNIGDTIWKKTDHSNRITISSIDEYFYYANSYNILIEIADKEWELVEQKSVVPKFKVGDVIRNKWSNHTKKIIRIADDNSVYFLDDGIPGDYISAPISSQENWVLVEQKPAWSEEDERFFKTALWHISYSISKGKSTDFQCDTTEWFKSLKERYIWKPSDKQMLALSIAIEMEDGDILKSLYQDLLKLKG